MVIVVVVGGGGGGVVIVAAAVVKMVVELTLKVVATRTEVVVSEVELLS